MRQQDERHRPQTRFQGVARERLEILTHCSSIAPHLSHDRGIEILQAPASHYGIEAQDNHGSNNTQQTDETPGLTIRDTIVSPIGIGLRVAPYHKLTNHPRDAQYQDAGDIDQDKGSTAILTCHIRETPHVTQTNCRSCRCQDDTQFATEINSVLHTLYPA